MSVSDLSKPGSLVRARGREWVVLPESEKDLLHVRPLGGLDEEITGILPAVENVETASFSLPSPEDIGDYLSARLLFEAARLSTRAAAGPFRSFARIAVEPRPYQLVPLMMGLRLDPIRLLIADDVGIGKTIEAAMLLRELIDRGEIEKMTVLCPPHLAEQWQKELKEKFHIDAELILSSTIKRLERDLPIGTSVFDKHRYTIVSIDFIKGDRRASDFINKCPELVIVDEAHGCTLASGLGRGRQQRFDLIKKLSEDPERHMILVTATPHSGNEQAFRTLLGLLDSDFFELPLDLDRDERAAIRRKLASHIVQRRRADIRSYLETDTAFPTRKDREVTYTFSESYKKLFEDIMRFTLEYVSDKSGEERLRRIRYWSALALLRCVSSSPAAAAATLRSRAVVDETSDDVDTIGTTVVLDQDDIDELTTVDFSPGSKIENDKEVNRRKMLEFAKRAESLYGKEDNKMRGAVKQVEEFLKEGYKPIVFCRYIDTADYLAKQFRENLSNKIRVESVTGILPPAEREARIDSLANEEGSYVLVCTDCLSEGINLQDNFDAVLHYDLCWNPTRHEQREGRVDRFGQEKPEVRVVTYYGKDNPVDSVILDVLIRKHKSIKSDLGVTVAVPGSSEQIANALFEWTLFRQQSFHEYDGEQLMLDFAKPSKQEISKMHTDWEVARDKEKASRSRFAQHALDSATVAAELESVREAIGDKNDIKRFVYNSIKAANVPLKAEGDAVVIHLSEETPRALRQAIGLDKSFKGRFDLPLQEAEVYLGRTSPIVEGLAGWVLDQALDKEARDSAAIASRCGIIASSAVNERTTLILARFRYHLKIGGRSVATTLCEEIVPLAFKGKAEQPDWMSPEDSLKLLNIQPDASLPSSMISQQINFLTGKLTAMQESLSSIAEERAERQLEAHKRVRKAVKQGSKVSIETILPVDILGSYIILPKAQ